MPDTFEALDAYARWSVGEGLPYLFPQGEAPDYFPLTVELQGITVTDFAAGNAFFDDPDRIALWRSAIRIAPVYTALPRELTDQLTFVTAFATRSFFELAANPSNARLREVLVRVSISRPIRKSSLSLDPKEVDEIRWKTGPLVPNSVVVGIIDDGIAFGHERFRKGDGTTRIESIWLQDGTPPAGLVSYGRVIRKLGPGGIDQVLLASTHAGHVDEDEFYRRSGAADFTDPPAPPPNHRPVAWRTGHGTHVLDLAAGAPPGSAPTWPIVCVQLPVATTADTSGDKLTPYVIDAIWYILWQSLVVSWNLNSAPLPVVINLSYGFTGGPLDGTGSIEAEIDVITTLWQLIVGAKVRVVVAAGNNHLSRVHAQVQFQAANEVVELPWRILPDDQSISFVEIWMPKRLKTQASPIEVRIVSPTGAVTTPWVNSTNIYAALPPVGPPKICEVFYDYRSSLTSRGWVLIAVKPTTDHSGAGSANAQSVAPCGTWRIQMRNRNGAMAIGERVHACVRRDDIPYGYPVFGRQSHFDDPVYQKYYNAGREVEVDNASIVKRENTINAMATGRNTIVVGGTLRKEQVAARYSSSGPATSPTGQSLPAPFRRPDVLAVSDDSRVHYGVLAAGTRSGSVVAMNGTSVAAPMITRRVAQNLATNGPGDRPMVQALATAVPTPPPERNGTGKVVLAPLHWLRP